MTRGFDLVVDHVWASDAELDAEWDARFPGADAQWASDAELDADRTARGKLLELRRDEPVEPRDQLAQLEEQAAAGNLDAAELLDAYQADEVEREADIEMWVEEDLVHAAEVVEYVDANPEAATFAERRFAEVARTMLAHRAPVRLPLPVIVAWRPPHRAPRRVRRAVGRRRSTSRAGPTRPDDSEPELDREAAA